MTHAAHAWRAATSFDRRTLAHLTVRQVRQPLVVARSKEECRLALCALNCIEWVASSVLAWLWEREPNGRIEWAVAVLDCAEVSGTAPA